MALFNNCDYLQTSFFIKQHKNINYLADLFKGQIYVA
jgi:hypothetical protein